MGVVTRIADLGARATGRLLAKFFGKTQIANLVEVFTDELQTLEDTLYNLHTKTLDIDGAEGVQLDTIGVIVGEARGTSANDAEYRQRLKAWIRSRLAKGATEGVYATLSMLTTASIHGYENVFSSVEYAIVGQIVTASTAAVLLRLLDRSIGADDRGVLTWGQSASADLAWTATSSATVRTQLNGAASAAATSVATDSVVGFPATGTIVIAPDTGDQMTASYTATSVTTLLGNVTLNPGSATLVGAFALFSSGAAGAGATGSTRYYLVIDAGTPDEETCYGVFNGTDEFEDLSVDDAGATPFTTAIEHPNLTPLAISSLSAGFSGLWPPLTIAAADNAVVALSTAAGKPLPVLTTIPAGAAPTDTTLNVDSAAKFPASGSLVLSPGLAAEETVTYTGKNATQFTGVSPLVNFHAADAEVISGRGGKLAFAGEAS